MTDPALRRLERDAIVVCVAAAAITMVAPRGGWRLATGVLGGGALVAMSYWGIKTAVDRLFRTVNGTRRRILWPLAMLGVRYALLAFLAYVMIARLRLHPIGLLIGASSVVLAAAIEAARIAHKHMERGTRGSRGAL